MSRMVRREIEIDAEQDEQLKRRARELGVSESELIRRAIEEALRRPPRDEQAWEDEMAFIEERARNLPPVVPDSERRWSREEMYDERWNRRISG